MGLPNTKPLMLNLRVEIESEPGNFSRYDADCLLKNIFDIFENNNANGRVSNNDILYVFSMGMSGTGRHWPIFFRTQMQKGFDLS